MPLIEIHNMPKEEIFKEYSGVDLRKFKMALCWKMSEIYQYFNLAPEDWEIYFRFYEREGTSDNIRVILKYIPRQAFTSRLSLSKPTKEEMKPEIMEGIFKVLQEFNVPGRIFEIIIEPFVPAKNYFKKINGGGSDG